MRRAVRHREEIAELAVDRLGAQGDGIAQWRGEPVFLPFTVPGDVVMARLGPRRGDGRAGLVIERLVSGPGRVEPVCRHFGRCGGCALQHLDAAAYRGVKLGALNRALQRVGIDPAVVEPLVTVPPQRRRARLGLTRPREPMAPAMVGFRERFRHALIDLRQCAVLEAALFALIEPLRRIGRDVLMPGGSAEVLLTRTDSGVDLLIEAAQEPGLGAVEALAGLAARHDLARIVWRARGTDVPIVERLPVRVMLSGVAVPFPPGAFLQASAAAEAALVSEAAATIGARRPALDLFAGLGTFAFALAAAGPVHAVEGDAAAAAALARAAGGKAGVTAEQRDLERDPLMPEALAGYAAAVFDPPRAGAPHQAAALAAAAIDTVVAVSCNPATFARDAARLIAGGYRIDRVVAIDQFAWTAHLELVASFRR